MTITWQIDTLANGLRVVTVPVPTAQSVAVNLFVRAGSRHEEPRIAGLTHFMEHMLFKGTKKRPSAIVIAEAIEGAGGILNAYTGNELTCYWNRVPFDRLPLAVDVLADMLRNSLFDPQEIERESSVVRQEIQRRFDQPSSRAGDLLFNAVYGDQPIGRPVLGTDESVASARRDDFIGYMGKWYAPSNIVLSVGGNTTPEEVVALANRHLGDIPDHAVPRVERFSGGLPSRHVIVETRDIAQCNMDIATHAISRNDPARYAMLVLNAVLGQGMSSRLFKEVRERRGLAYAVGSGPVFFVDTGLVSVFAGVAADKLVEATRVIKDEIMKLASELVGPDELEKARDYSIGGFRLSLETPMALAQRAGESLLLSGEIESIEEVVDGLRAVTAEDVRLLAERVFRPGGFAMAVVSPSGDAEELAAILDT